MYGDKPMAHCRVAHKRRIPLNLRRFKSVYNSMVSRCNNKNNPRYGGRGIRVEWKSFDDFKNDMYETYLLHITNNLCKYGRNTSIERVNNDGNYSKGNCTWATRQEQAKNKGTNVKLRQVAK